MEEDLINSISAIIFEIRLDTDDDLIRDLAMAIVDLRILDGVIL